MIFLTRNFDPLTPLAPKFPNFATQILLFRLKYTVAVVTHAQNFFTPLGYWVLLAKKQRLGPKLAGGLTRGASKKMGPPYLFLKPLKLATEKLVHNMSSGLPCQTQILGPN